MFLLTTPVMSEYDSVFPGENWFFYWKTSPSLWESKLSNTKGDLPLFVPIYWGLHSEHPDHYDFAKRIPETDLKRLSEVAERTSRSLVFVLFLGPAPFLPNGGVPSFLSRTLALDQRGIGKAVIDSEGKLNKLFSFFDPRIFQAYRKFLLHLSQYFVETGIKDPIYVAKAAYTQNDRIESYFLDSSKMFESGFSRYVKKLQSDEPARFQEGEFTPKVEANLKKDFKSMVEDLFYESCKELLPPNFQGLLHFGFLGGAVQDSFPRSSDRWEIPLDFFKNTFDFLSLNFIPTTVLLNQDLKKGTLIRAVSDLFSKAFLENYLESSHYDEDLTKGFSPLEHFRLYGNPDDYFFNKKYASKIGLLPYLEKKYDYTYRFLDSQKEDDEGSHAVSFYLSENISKTTFQKMLKNFMNGKQVFVDQSKLSSELKNKLELFFIENDLRTEKIHYLTDIVKVELGEGVLIAFYGDKLEKEPIQKKLSFWESLLKYTDVRHIESDVDSEIFSLWKSRYSNAMELSFEHIRRVSLYNPSSYKKKAKYFAHKNFAFIKVVDENKVSVRSTPLGVEIELLPQGSVSIDFGYFD